MEKPDGRDLEWSLTFQARPRGAKTESFGSGRYPHWLPLTLPDPGKKTGGDMPR